jgi:hypothetical protein
MRCGVKTTTRPLMLRPGLQPGRFTFNIREQAAQRAEEGHGEDLAAIWKNAALKAAQVAREASRKPEKIQDGDA